MIDPTERAEAIEKFEIKVRELEHKEEKELKNKAKIEIETRETKDRTDAFVEHIRLLFDKMYDEDIDGNIMNQIPG